jgi:hypothetical protein
MSELIGLSVPKQHLEILIYFFGLPNEVKEKFFSSINEYDGELSPKKLVEYLSLSMDIEKRKLFDLSVVFLTLVHSINAYDGTIDNFVSQVGESLIETYPDEVFDEQRALETKRFFENSSISTVKAKVSELMSETHRYFIESKIFQDLRTSFDDNGNIIASGIIHNLKISTQEGRKRKDVFISMDSRDLESLSKEIKKAQENSKNIQTAFNNANILDI